MDAIRRVKGIVCGSSSWSPRAGCWRPGPIPTCFPLRAVARAAGIAPSVYLQFAGKEALLHAVIADHFARFQQAIEAGLATSQDPASALLGGCFAYCRFAIDLPGSYRIILETPARDWPHLADEEPLGIAAFQILVDAVAACIVSGQAKPGDPFAIASNIWVALHGTVTLRRQMPGFPLVTARGPGDRHAGGIHRDSLSVIGGGRRAPDRASQHSCDRQFFCLTTAGANRVELPIVPATRVVAGFGMGSG